MNSSIEQDHLSQELLLLLLDDELSSAQRLQCEAHVAVCEVCGQKLTSLHEFSMQIETAVQSLEVAPMASVRTYLQNELTAKNTTSTAVLPSPDKVMRRFGWGMGIAATLAFGLLTASHYMAPQPGISAVSQVTPAQSGVIEIDGETFLPVPYSNSELSTASPHIVQMQVPVSSLADIGIVLEPVMNQVGAAPESERLVLADVLVGADGQPRGVHVLGLE